MSYKLFEARQMSVSIGRQHLLRNLSFTLRKGEAWAIVGAAGSGKTTLGQVIAGRCMVTSGTWQLHADTEVRIAMVEQQHQFRNYQDFYYQARFQSTEAESSPLVEELLMHILKKKHDDSKEADRHITDTLKLLGMYHLKKSRILKLSNGEHKKLQIAQALLQEPEVMVLDNPFVGLDQSSRKSLHQLVNRLFASGMLLVLITTPREIPQAITHVMELSEGSIRQICEKESYVGISSQAAGHPERRLDLQQLQAMEQPEPPAFATAFRLQQVTVRYGERLILNQVDWEVKRGEKWALTGHNGAGKSTLLSLINGDHPQAYANDILLFDRRKGSGESIWEIKSRIGYVSPELHLYFSRTMSCEEAVATGFSGTMATGRHLTEPQQQTCRQWMHLLGLEHLKSRKMGEVSLGNQRLVLLARALVKNPPVLILDEPCQGMDSEQQAQFVQLVDTICMHFQKTLVYVSHYTEEIPRCIEKMLLLEQGVAHIRRLEKS